METWNHPMAAFSREHTKLDCIKFLSKMDQVDRNREPLLKYQETGTFV